jgi:hypothetical protein
VKRYETMGKKQERENRFGRSAPTKYDIIRKESQLNFSGLWLGDASQFTGPFYDTVKQQFHIIYIF